MKECVVQLGLFDIGSFYLYSLVVLAGIAVTRRDSSGFLLAFITALFYSISKTYHCEIKAIDQLYMFRYLFWVGLDLLYLCTVYLWLGKTRFINRFVLKGLLVVHLGIWLLHCLRVIDIHLLVGINIRSFYGVGIAVANFLIVLLVATQVLSKKKDLRGNHGNNNHTQRNRSNRSSFLARFKGL